MRITIVAVGMREPAWVDTAVADYLGRFPKDFRVELKLVRTEPRNGQSVQRIMASEAERIRKAIPEDAMVVVLDERGRDWTTMEFSQKIKRWGDEGLSVAFIIGGPDGLDADFKKSAAQQIRLSTLTLPHGMARVLLCEQLYRVWSLLHNHPYHRA